MTFSRSSQKKLMKLWPVKICTRQSPKNFWAANLSNISISSKFPFYLIPVGIGTCYIFYNGAI